MTFHWACFLNNLPMIKRLVYLFLFFLSFDLFSQVTTVPAFPKADEPVTIIYDATQGTSGLVGASGVMMHAGVILNSASGTTWSNVVGTWGSPSSMGMMSPVEGQPNKWQITITPRSYFNVAAGTPIYRIGMVFRESGPCGGFSGNNTPCKEGKSSSNSDIFVNLYSGNEFLVTFSTPSSFPLFKNTNEQLDIVANSSKSASLTLKINNNVVIGPIVSTTLSYPYTILEPAGSYRVTIIANDGSTEIESSFDFIVRGNTIVESRPSGIRSGINYHTDQTKVTLSFLAPQKSSVYVIGDFNDWQVSPDYQMKKDGEHFWLEIDGLTSGVEYAYQFLIDEKLYVADPFCDKILDPSNDQYISASIYPGLKQYPSGKATGIVSVLQTGQLPYVWEVPQFVRPAKEKLNVYKLLIRDFDNPGTYQAVIDRLDYLKTLGINAIELMPIMEFSGNISWGYNPIFYFAADKAYGTKNKLKELVDKAHAKGMAVILDMVLNQADFEFPYVKMYWDGGKPASNSPWFNRDATHPFNVFFDFNHSSPYTQALVDTINQYWLKEYKFDGFRFDLSKGFTQTVNTDVNAWSAYDQSRIDILTRMANKIWETDPTAYVILEHLGVDSEERVLANSGMMLWGIMTYSYKQNTLGFSSGSDVWRTYYKNRSGTPWDNPASIMAYMESHDEERLMYDNIQFGNSTSGYSVKTLSNALERMKAAHALLFSIPGPKLMWQFGELGYDYSINSSGGRTNPKPVRWDYFDQTNRLRLYKTVSALLNLRNQYEVFHTSNLTMNLGTDLVKSVVLRSDPFVAAPSSAQEMSVVMVANFDVTPQTRTIGFPALGKWYHYFSRPDSIMIGTLTNNLTLQPGEFRIYTNYKLPPLENEIIQFSRPNSPTLTTLVEESYGIRTDWSDNSIIETGYKIFRSENQGEFIEVAQLGSGTLTHWDINSLKPFTDYRYFVQAYNAIGVANSDTLSITSTSVVTSTNTEGNSASIIVYPNPTQGIISLTSDIRVIELVIRNLYGVAFKPERLTENRWDVSLLGNGVYIVEVRTDRGSHQLKLIKNN